MSVVDPVLVPWITTGAKGTGSLAGSAVIVPEIEVVCAEAKAAQSTRMKVIGKWSMENEEVRMSAKQLIHLFVWCENQCKLRNAGRCFSRACFPNLPVVR